MSSVVLKNVAVLMGGFSAEREVSLSTAQGAIEALESLGHKVTPIDVTRDISKLIEDLTPKPDVVVNVLHGRWGKMDAFKDCLKCWIFLIRIQGF